MIVTCDWETYYDQHYSLTKMSTADYILDHRFQSIMCAVKVNNAPTEIYIGHREIAQRFKHIDWSRSAFLAHNTRFDGAILGWRYGIEPAMYLDTLSMARATTHWKLGRSSLKAVSDYLGLPPKGDEVVRAMGKRLEDFSHTELNAYAEYCARDNDNCREIFDKLRPLFGGNELRLIDIIMRMFILPQVKLDPNVLAEHLNQVRTDKAQALAKVAHIDPAVFSSNQKFAALLETMGVDVPRKISPTTGYETPALAKNDRGFKELCMDESQPLEVQAILAARMNSKSTLEEKRTQKLLDQSLMDWPARSASEACRSGSDARLGEGQKGWGAVPLKYYGARPGRISGDDKVNWLNFRRGSKVRDAIVAPPGYRVVHRDASQIEARMVAWLARCKPQLEAFADPKRDLYCEFASTVYGRVVTKNEKELRFVGGKVPILQLQYASGPDKYRHTLFIGNGGMSVSIDEAEARRIVYHYRNTYPEIPELWEAGEFLIQRVIAVSRDGVWRRRDPRSRGGGVVALDPTHLENIVKPGFDALWLPNGMCIAYPNIRYERNPATNGLDKVYDDPYGGWRKIYGGKVTENISQALSRIIVTDIAVRTFDLTGYHPFLHTYDSLDYCVPEQDVEWWDKHLETEFAKRPTWAVDLPLASEGGWGRTLLAAERGDNQ